MLDEAQIGQVELQNMVEHLGRQQQRLEKHLKETAISRRPSPKLSYCLFPFFKIELDLWNELGGVTEEYIGIYKYISPTKQSSIFLVFPRSICFLNTEFTVDQRSRVLLISRAKRISFQHGKFHDEI